MFARVSFLVAVFSAVIIGVTVVPEAVEAMQEGNSPGDKLVTIVRTPVQLGEETLMVLEKGTGLEATEVRDKWIGVNVARDNEQVFGPKVMAANDKIAAVPADDLNRQSFCAQVRKPHDKRLRLSRFFANRIFGGNPTTLV